MVLGENHQGMKRKEAGGQAQGREPGDNRGSGEKGYRERLQRPGGGNFPGTERTGWKLRVCSASQAKLMKREPHADTLGWNSRSQRSSHF